MKKFLVVIVVVGVIIYFFFYKKEQSVQIDDPGHALIEIYGGLVEVVESHQGNCSETDGKMQGYIGKHIDEIKEIQRQIDNMDSQSEYRKLEEKLVAEVDVYIEALEKYARECPEFRQAILELVRILKMNR